MCNIYAVQLIKAPYLLYRYLTNETCTTCLYGVSPVHHYFGGLQKISQHLSLIHYRHQHHRTENDKLANNIPHSHHSNCHKTKYIVLTIGDLDGNLMVQIMNDGYINGTLSS